MREIGNLWKQLQDTEEDWKVKLEQKKSQIKSEDKNASDEESPVKKRLKESSLFCGQNEVILY